MAEQEELGVKTPLGSFEFKGSQMFPVILLILFAACAWYMSDDFNKANAQQHAVFAKGQEEVKAEIVKGRETQEALIYVMSLTPAEREKLQLTKPKRLAEMQR